MAESKALKWDCEKVGAKAVLLVLPLVREAAGW